MPEIQNIPVSDMEIILSGIHTEHPAGGADSDFASSIYALFEEFRRDYYREEWRRLDENVRIYQGKYWDSANASKENPDIVPKSVTPIITSVIENIKADLSDELPEAVIQPDATDKTILAKVLTKVIEQELDVCDWERSYGLGENMFARSAFTGTSSGRSSDSAYLSTSSNVMCFFKHSSQSTRPSSASSTNAPPHIGQSSPLKKTSDRQCGHSNESSPISPPPFRTRFGSENTMSHSPHLYITHEPSLSQAGFVCGIFLQALGLT